jgi:hypothetical protein
MELGDDFSVEDLKERLSKRKSSELSTPEGQPAQKKNNTNSD